MKIKAQIQMLRQHLKMIQTFPQPTKRLSKSNQMRCKISKSSQYKMKNNITKIITIAVCEVNKNKNYQTHLKAKINSQEIFLINSCMMYIILITKVKMMEFLINHYRQKIKIVKTMEFLIKATQQLHPKGNSINNLCQKDHLKQIQQNPKTLKPQALCKIKKISQKYLVMKLVFL
ncbi:hypothetical protein TTHERM_001164069 (macronuclear) [Tetrahymena thermophila SB210]|uniref:Uncharacterized protein n=1 Tax=Tetrahymena thermophila (strain SB210) TaxID=312017 RepID=W7X202_TETTS|nr:hypothetical protein TTHERM_001164069 [Tetrahymena thermophila SB210]EWS71662.1 hypothetical protein TTHERM_001164069 [Tetrahymena thermophila SB210]|eukprot:XP_012655801.1 hypothetical protein TTHERM_001164069 [Tetrahymena thermophila SB210]